MGAFVTIAASACGLPGLIQTLPGDSVVGSPAGLALGNDGIYTKVSDFSTGAWLLPSSSSLASQWECRVTVTSGALSSGTTGSWVDMATGGTWARNTAGSATLTFEFRDKATQTVRSTQTGVVIQRL